MSNQTNIAAVLPAIGKDLELVTLPVPKPGPSDVLIRTSVIAINPIDQVRQAYGFMVPACPKVLGSDTTGTVVAVGADVASDAFKVGDRVVAVTDGFIAGDNDRESYQTFAVAPTATTAKLPDSVAFLQGSTISLVLMTAATIFFDGLKFAIPGATETTPETIPLPKSGSESAPIVVIWGGASSVGVMAIQLAHFLGFTVYTTASPRHHARLQTLGADVVVDYSSPETAVEELLKAAGEQEIMYAVDTVNSTEKTIPFLEQLLLKSTATTSSKTVPTLVHINMLPKYVWQEGLVHQFITAADAWTRRKDISAWIFSSGNLTRWLADGTFVPPTARVVSGGLSGLQNALNLVKGGVSGEKLVVELA